MKEDSGSGGSEKMKGKISRYLLCFLWVLVVLSCSPKTRLMVVYDRTEGLKPGDRVLWENQTIGSVGDFNPHPSDKTVVPLRIKPDYRQALTDQSRFLILADPDHPGSQSVKMVLLATGGKPLPDGAVVEGSTPFSVMAERGSLGLQGLPKLLQDALDRLNQELSRLSDRQWQKELESQVEAWIRLLEKSGQEARRHFQKEVLPKLEQSIRDLLRLLKDLGKEEDGKSLEKKLEELKRTLNP